jgi:hypothetical protein
VYVAGLACKSGGKFEDVSASNIYPVSDRRNDVAGVALVISLGWRQLGAIHDCLSVSALLLAYFGH